MKNSDQYRELAATGKLRRIIIGRRELLTLFTIRGAKYPQSITIPEIDNLPTNCTIIHSYMDERHLAYYIVIHSNEFDVVLEGGEIPLLEARFRYVSLTPTSYVNTENEVDEYFSQIDALYKELEQYRKLFEDTKHDIINPDTKKMRIVAEMWGYQLGRANCLTDIGKLLPMMIGAVDRVFLSDELARMRSEHVEPKTTLDPNVPYNKALQDVINMIAERLNYTANGIELQNIILNMMKK